jgi:hypothetical protein
VVAGIPVVAVLTGGVAVASRGRAGVRSAEPGNRRGEEQEDRRGDLLCSGGLGGSMERSPFLLAPPSGVVLGEWWLGRGAAAVWMGRARARDSA